MAFRRREEPPKKKIKVDHFRKVADARYGDELLGKLINKVMLGGKKSTAEKIVYTALDMVEERTGQSGIDAFKQALDKIKPLVEVKSRRVGGSTYQVPIEVSPNRRTSLGLRWLVNYTRSRSEKTMAEKLAGEIQDALQDRGASIKKRDDTHAMAEANKAFAHFRW
ncbi:MAG: 30S ribosomal protein S7 [Deltaproteobacteria bacterium]|nr:MAG: 30S ribosomal protein S7 [Deltaproteobacteria bacterium]